MDQQILKDYAELIARMGVNIQPGQEVIITASTEQQDFLYMLTEECYKAGASKVEIIWTSQELDTLHYKYQTDETLGTVEPWEELRWKQRVEKLPCRIFLESDDPDGLSGVDQEKLAKSNQARYKVIKPYRDAMDDKHQWCIAAVPGVKWARKIFPGLSDEEAVEKLWQAIIKCSRAEENPIEAWKQHNEELKKRCDWLNSLSLRRLIYKSESTGTDFSVGLMEESRFMGGADPVFGTDIMFDANIPSEEVYTSPRRGDAEGIVYASMPLAYRGVLIEDFSIRFENGRAVEVKAKKNEEALRLMIAMDEGACMLGECALVPFHSPIRESGILFCNTLFDENAACHLALGDGYANTMAGAENRSLEQARELGLNESIIHEDFMIGCADLNITGITADGRAVPIFVDGDWA